MATAATPKGKAVLIGATGAIGCCLFGELLRCKEHFEKVVVFGRNRKAVVPDGYGVTAEEEEASGRLIQHIQDFDELPESKIKELCTGSSVFFSCMGSTRKQAGSAQAFYHIDFELNMKFATAAKAEEVPHFSLVSSSGASPTSWIHYMKTKGQLDEAVKALNFKCLTILRPGLLDRGQERRRFFEKVSLIILSGISVATVAQAMLYDAITVLSAATVRDPSLIVADNTLIRRLVSEGTKPKAEATSPDSDQQAKPSETPANESTPAATETTESTPAATETTESTPAAAETTESTPAATETTESTPAATETTESTPAAAETPESTTAEETKTEEITTESAERAEGETTADEVEGEGEETAEKEEKEEEQKEEDKASTGNDETKEE